MPRAKIRKTPTPPWLAGREYKFNKNKTMPPWIKLDTSLMTDALFRDGLTDSAQITFFCMCLEAGDRAGREWFPFHHGTAARYHIKTSTFRRNVRELQEKGFLAVKRPETGWKSDTFAPNQYMIITKWKDP